MKETSKTIIKEHAYALLMGGTLLAALIGYALPAALLQFFSVSESFRISCSRSMAGLLAMMAYGGMVLWAYRRGDKE